VAVAALLVALAPEVLVSAAGGIGSPIAVALSLPLALLAVLPPAIFLMFAWRPGSRALPTAGTACLLTFAVLILAGWLVPLSGDVLQDFLRQSVVGEQPLLGDIPYPPPVSRAEALLAVTGWAAVVGATAICAAMMARRSPLESRWWLAGVPVIYLALIPVFQYTIGSSFLVFLSAGDPPVGFRPGIAAWTTAAVLMAGALPGGLTAGQERSDYGVPS
jgi:hypothetical protein